MPTPRTQHHHRQPKPAFKKHPLAVAIHVAFGTMLGALPLAHAGPTGGTVVGGRGTISHDGVATIIQQASKRMAINWQSYDLKSNERVQYIQPNAKSISLNRILSNNGSTIAGRIDANGRVILVNANGIFFTSTATINVGSLIASGLDINTGDFLKNKYVFSEVPGTGGNVINQGLITASLGGSVALLGKSVKNEGTIHANLGSVGLAAGKEAVLTFDSEGLLGIKVTKEVLQDELGVDPAVLNSGDIQAHGGRVVLTASQSRDVFSRAVNTGGVEQATSVVVNADGSFTLGGGADVQNTGNINVSAASAGQNAGRIALIGENVTSSGTLRADAERGNGGEIELHARDKTMLTQDSLTSARAEVEGKGGIVKVLGDKVGMFDHSTVDVSGANGGGQALIGGDFQGSNKYIRNSSMTIVNAGTSIYADGMQNGDGGKVILWSDGATYFGGDIYARGGALAGNGGLVETSGKVGLVFRGNTDRSAANGQAGLLLLDPRDITIATGTGGPPPSSPDDSQLGDRQVNFADCTGTSCTTGQSENFTISATALQTQLAGGGVQLQANNDIFINAAVSTTSSRDLTLDAGRSIEINANISLNGGAFEATINHANAGSGRGTGNAAFTMAAGTSITTSGGNITIITGARSSGVGDISLQTLNASGTSSNSGAGDITIRNGTGDISVNGLISANGYAPSSGNGGNGGNIILRATGVNGDVRVSTHATLDALISANGGSGASGSDGGHAGSVLITAGNDIELNEGVSANGGNSIADTGPENSDPAGNGGAIRLSSGRDILIYGAINSNGGNSTNGGGQAGSGAALRSLDGTEYSGISFDVGRNLTVEANISAGAGSASNGANSGVSGAILMNGTTAANIFSINNNISFTGSSITVNGQGNSNDALVRGGATPTTNTWTISGENDGRLEFGTNAPIIFTDIANLTGGSGVDNFIINSSAGALSGLMSGGGGADTLSISNNSINQTIQINNTDTSANLTVRQIESISANSGTTANNILVGSNTAANVWSIGATPTTNTVSDGTTTTTFSNFATVRGGNHASGGSETFTVNSVTTPTASNSVTNIDTGTGGAIAATVTINAGASVLGTLTAGAGTNNIDIYGTVGNISGTVGNGVNNIEVFGGGLVNTSISTGSGNDTIVIGEAGTGTPAAVVGAISTGIGTNSVTVHAGDTAGSITTGTGSNTVGIYGTAASVGGNAAGGTNNITVYAGGQVSGAITTGAGVDTIVVNGTAISISTGAGEDNITIASPASVTSAVANAIDGGLDNDTLTVSSAGNTWVVDNTGTGGTVTNGPETVGFAGIEYFNTGGASGVLDYSGVTINVLVDLNRFTGFSTIIGSDSSVTSTLIGRNGVTNNWYLGQVIGQPEFFDISGVPRNDGVNDGVVVYGAANTTVNFINFNLLTGGASGATNNFYITDSATSPLATNGLYTGIITGGAASTNRLYARDIADTRWTINSSNSTLVYTTSYVDDGSGNLIPVDTTTTFNGINELIGAATQDDSFTFNTSPGATVVNGQGQATPTGDAVTFSALAGTINLQLGATGFSGIERYTGNGANSTITASEAGTNTWIVDGAQDGWINGTRFFDFARLVGANSQDDNFTFSVTPAIANVTVIGGGAATILGDTVTLNAAGSNVLLDTVFTGIERFTASNAATNSTMTANGAGAYEWSITAARFGTIGGNITFSGFSALAGSDTGNDTFNFSVTPAVANMTVNGRGGTGDSVSFAGVAGAIDLQLGSAGFNNIESYTGNGTNSTLRAANSAMTAWDIDSVNGGDINNNIFFTGFNVLAGGTGTDTFNLNNNGHITGYIDGGSGTGNTLNINRITNVTTPEITVRLSDTVPTVAPVNPVGTIAATRMNNVNGRAGNNHTLAIDLADPNTTTPVWNITQVNGGSVNFGPIVNFTNFRNLAGSAGSDTFNLTNTSTTALVTGYISGEGTPVGGEDVLTLTGMTVDASNVSVELWTGIPNAPVAGRINVTGINRIEGNGSSNLYAHGNTANDWTLSGANDGSVIMDLGNTNSLFVFNNFDSLYGGGGDDNFRVTFNGSLAASVTGGGESLRDTIDYSAQTVVNINFENEAFNGITGIEAVRGNGTNSTLNGPSGGADWVINGVNMGSVVNTTGNPSPMGFEGFNYLTGGNGNDEFTISNGGSLRNTTTNVPGTIRGGGGDNDVIVQLTGIGSASGQINYIGTGATDVITVENTSINPYTGSYTPVEFITDAVNPGNGGNYQQLSYSYSDTIGNNTSFAINYRGASSVVSEQALSTFTVNGTDAFETIELRNGTPAGTSVFQFTGTTPYTAVSLRNVDNLVINGQGGVDTIHLNNASFSGNTVRLTSEFVTGAGATALTANELILENVGQFGASTLDALGNPTGLINTELDTLRLIGSNDVNISDDNLTLITSGTVTNTGIFRITGTTTFDAGNSGDLTLSNVNNDFDTINTANGVTAASINLTDRDNILGGSMNATALTLNTATGIGDSGTFLNTTSSLITVNNTSGGVHISNTGAATVNIVTDDDLLAGLAAEIRLTNFGILTIDRLYTNGVGIERAGQTGMVTLNVDGSIFGVANRDIEAIPDVTAAQLIVNTTGGMGVRQTRPISIGVTDYFYYDAPSEGHVFYFFRNPLPQIDGPGNLVSYTPFNALSSLRLLEVESLDEIDPAIFTAVRNYYHEDVAILMPSDQRLDAAEEDEQAADKSGDTKTNRCEAQSGGANREKNPDAPSCVEKKEENT